MPKPQSRPKRPKSRPKRTSQTKREELVRKLRAQQADYRARKKQIAEARPRTLRTALNLLTPDDRVFLATEHFDLPPSEAGLLLAEAVALLAQETDRTEPGPEGSVLVWIDPEGVVKVPVFP